MIASDPHGRKRFVPNGSGRVGLERNRPGNRSWPRTRRPVPACSVEVRSSGRSASMKREPSSRPGSRRALPARPGAPCRAGDGSRVRATRRPPGSRVDGRKARSARGPENPALENGLPEPLRHRLIIAAGESALLATWFAWELGNGPGATHRPISPQNRRTTPRRPRAWPATAST